MTDLITKYQLDTHVFSSPLEAESCSMDMGLEGEIHVVDVNGQAYYMPGESHEDYLESMSGNGEGEVEEVSEDRMMEALRVVVETILNKNEFEDWGEGDEITKAEYQGRQVPLNKPRRLSGENKKFEVFVRDGDKVKRVTFGDPDLEIRRDNPEARASFRARHQCDTATDKTSARYWACRFWERGTTVSELTKNFEVYGEVTKVDDEQRIVYGFASVVSKNGEVVVDRQGDVITAEEMERAATNFMLGARNGLTMHKGEPTTTIVHSLPLTKQVMDAFGISSDKEGWLIAVKVHDDDTWDRMKKGEFTGFSIGGRARKVRLDD